MLRKQLSHIAALLLVVFVSALAERGFHHFAHAAEAGHYTAHASSCHGGAHDVDGTNGITAHSDDASCELCDFFASNTHFDAGTFDGGTLFFDTPAQACRPSADRENTATRLQPLRGPPSA